VETKHEVLRFTFLSIPSFVVVVVVVVVVLRNCVLDDFSFGMNKAVSRYDQILYMFLVFRITLTFSVRTILGFISLLRNASWAAVMNPILICETYTRGGY
jgi:hypothetical protein